jgi:hypothetical protein
MMVASTARPFAYCTQCDAVIREGSTAIYDDYREQYFCDRRCFNEWARDNDELIQRFYERMNVGEVDT